MTVIIVLTMVRYTPNKRVVKILYVVFMLLGIWVGIKFATVENTIENNNVYNFQYSDLPTLDTLSDKDCDLINKLVDDVGIISTPAMKQGRVTYHIDLPPWFVALPENQQNRLTKVFTKTFIDSWYANDL